MRSLVFTTSAHHAHDRQKIFQHSGLIIWSQFIAPLYLSTEVRSIITAMVFLIALFLTCLVLATVDIRCNSNITM